MSPRSATSETGTLCFAAVGDILLASDPTGTAVTRGIDAAFAGIQSVLANCDIMLGNLECTLAGDGGAVPVEPRVVSTPEMVRGLKRAGFTAVTLANNHTFDCLQGGFHRVRGLLEELGIAHFGAGDDLREASAPMMVEARGIRLALLGAVDERSGARQFAAAGQPGVAPLDPDRLTQQIHELSPQVDHVIVTLHWGEERFLVPSPEQIRQARALVDAGASAVLGHHAHVIQGLEMYKARPILYSLGSFVVCDVPYADGDVLTWNRIERTGCIFLTDLTKGNIGSVRQLATYDDGREVSLDDSGLGERRIVRANRALAKGVTAPRYRREHLWVKTIRPVLGCLRWSRLRRLRLRHVGKAFAGLFRAARAR